MRIFALRRGKERPVDCIVKYLGDTVYRVPREQFDIDSLLQFLGEHAAGLYEKEVITPADYEYMKIDVINWEICEGSLIMPVVVSDTEERRYVYRLDANSDIIASVVQAFNTRTCMPKDKGLGIKEIHVIDNLLFTKANMIVDLVFKSSMHYTRTRIYYIADTGKARRIAEAVKVNDNFNVVANAVDGFIEGSLRSRWDVKFDNNQLSNIIEVSFLSEVIDSYKDTVTLVKKPEQSLSMFWQVHCFITGVYTATYNFRVEVYGLAEVDFNELQ